MRLDPDVRLGEIHRVLDQVAQPVDDLGFAQDRRLVNLVSGFGVVGVMDVLAAMAVRFGGLGNHGHQRGLPQVQVILARPPHVTQNIAAPVRLIADQLGILAQVRRVAQFFDQLGTGQLDGGQRCAQFMRRCGHHAPQIGQLLFARQRHLRG